MKTKNWKTKKGKLRRSFEFKDFVEALGFITKVGVLAEKQGHHPEIFNVYNKVDIALVTHDAGDKITQKDHKLAKAINKL